MGKLESIERYGNAYGWPEAYPWVREMAEAVEREVEGRFMELPVDDDGEPIHVGDKVTAVGEQCYKVMAVSDDGIAIDHEDDGFEMRLASAWFRCGKLTVEDALVRFLADWEGVPASEINATNPKIAAHAERVREAARAE